MAKKILIITGPQGSGNHMWSKIFALHPWCYGWNELLDEYWIGHDREPFAEYWSAPEKLVEFNWNQSDYYVTSMSIPYMLNGEPAVPDIKSFVEQLHQLGHSVQIAVIGRDQNILEMQQQRVRGAPTVATALETISKLNNFKITFISFELLHLYKHQYLKHLEDCLQWPMLVNDPAIDKIICEDANNKYFHPVEHYWVDELAKKSSKKWR